MNKEQYKGVMVFAEQREGVIQNVAYELIGKARELAEALGEKVTALLCGYNVADQAKELIAAGADTVLVVDDKHLEHYVTEPYAQAVTHVINSKMPEIVLLGATTIGRDLGPRLSARLLTGLTADCTSLEIGDDRNLLMTRPAFGGNLMATIISKNHRPQMSTVRPGVMRRKAMEYDRTGEVEKISVPFDTSKFRVRLLKREKEEKNMIDITEAHFIVCGGRGVGTHDGFSKLSELAKTINGEIASSRAMVDAGLVGHERQVGQTGKTVRPDVYMAIGVSGAIQHLAGMEESEYIIAINKDKYAPIFQVADLGVVGDLHKVVPILTAKIKSAQQEKK
ncbi:electron transfer flavoprotein subunit alpha [Porphyromonas canoris]|uniref:electron transfer flavoprotein subunit alpha/FixB family protein n=1 Tax=Porphyromonas TaxID=836 RepID=UPI00051D6D50|nr:MULTISPECIES: electron transfer flavoprotein subunit alpha/FixB family protein [Porphyromonas]KGL52909.1 electron transfer flavoprotein subunit alpha [Porphyromonas canoris]KGN95533.1 electron transfer flavoprotein subunit alpha [Porphyromonas sp. COT-108 OH2963]